MHASRHPAAHAVAKALLSLALAGCVAPSDRGEPRPGAADAPDGSGAPALPWEAVPFVKPTEPENNPTTPEKVALGRALFYDPIVSADRQTACATCHSEEWGMGDGLARSIGLGGGLLAGPGRVGPNVVRRNAQTLWNVAYRETLFWDGRAESLEDQAHFPFEAADEFGRDLDLVLADLRATPEYLRLFRVAFPDEAEPVTADGFARAIAAFERTLVTDNSLYDAYVAGDAGALTEETRNGMFLFAEVGCADCHRPPLFSSERFEDRGVASTDGLDDLGRYEETGRDEDRNRFKVPTLRNTRGTGPFFHDGQTALLKDAVRHEASHSALHDGARPLDEEELSDITAFIVKGLLDTSRAPLRPREVPSGLDVPIDGFDILR